MTEKRSFCFLEPLNLQTLGFLLFLVPPSWWFILNIGIHLKLQDSIQKQVFFKVTPKVTTIKLNSSKHLPTNQQNIHPKRLLWHIKTPDPTKTPTTKTRCFVRQKRPAVEVHFSRRRRSPWATVDGWAPPDCYKWGEICRAPINGRLSMGNWGCFSLVHGVMGPYLQLLGAHLVWLLGEYFVIS